MKHWTEGGERHTKWEQNDSNDSLVVREGMQWRKKNAHKTRIIIVSWKTEYFYFCWWKWSNRKNAKSQIHQRANTKKIWTVCFHLCPWKISMFTVAFFFPLILHVRFFLYSMMWQRIGKQHFFSMQSFLYWNAFHSTVTNRLHLFFSIHSFILSRNQLNIHLL